MNAHVHPLFQALLAPFAPPPLPREEALRIVSQTHLAGSEKCEGCSHNRVTVESGTEAGKWGCVAYSECGLGMWSNDDPMLCPAVREHVANTTEAAEAQP